MVESAKISQGDRPSIDLVAPTAKRVTTLKGAPVVVNGQVVGGQTVWATVNPFAPPRKGNSAKWYVDGEQLMARMADDIAQATRTVYFTDWALNPDVRMRRDANSVDVQWSLRNILIKLVAARPTVQVRVLLYDSVDAMASTDTHDIEAENALEGAHANIRVVRHRWDKNWSHHQKTMIIDDTIAYIGGIDLYNGRWDNESHAVVHSKKPQFADDIYNPCIPEAEMSGISPRMPWHDVHMRFTGPSVADVARNFVERWNNERKPTWAGNEGELAAPAAPSGGGGRHQIQIVRSASPKSISTQKTVQSNIHEVYLKAIQGAQDFIYIENQFFTSKCEMKNCPILNDVASTLYARIKAAIEADQKFRVIVVVPVHSEGDIGAWSTQELMHWQYHTIRRSEHALLGKVEKLAATKGKRGEDYLFFASLRGHGSLPIPAEPKAYHATEQIYVHSKMMIVDDRLAIIGSANINDRSLLGSRDTELSAVILDEATEKATLNGRKVDVRQFARSLRIRLWKEHLGVWNDDARLGDPVADEVYRDLWIKTARDNTAIYDQVFPRTPGDRYTTMAAYKAAPRVALEHVARLKEIRGHLVAFPLDWLAEEDLETYGLDDILFTRTDPPIAVQGVG